MVGSTVEEPMDDDEDVQKSQMKYEVVGTVVDKEASYPSCVTEVVEVCFSVHNKQTFLFLNK